MNVSENNMANENNQSRSYPIGGLRLCIDRESETLVGRMYSKTIEKPIKFESSSNMLLEADDLFDQQGYPQRFMEPRSFQKDSAVPSRFHYPKPVISDQEILEQEGKCCTLDVFVQSRRKAGWQGAVFEPEGGFISEFKSELELLMILEKEINKKKPGKEG